MSRVMRRPECHSIYERSPPNGASFRIASFWILVHSLAPTRKKLISLKRRKEELDPFPLFPVLNLLISPYERSITAGQ